MQRIARLVIRDNAEDPWMATCLEMWKRIFWWTISDGWRRYISLRCLAFCLPG